MDDIITACSDTIERWCNRTFALTSYDELIDGSGVRNLLTSNYPVTYVDRVLYNPVQVLQIRNTDQGCSRASFRMDGTAGSPPAPNNLYLVSVKNGITTTRTIALSSTLMLSDLATAINAYSADGWAALALGVFATWPVSELWPFQGGKDCRWQGCAYVKHHTWPAQEIDYNLEIGEILIPQGFNWGYRNFRVIYQANYATVPSAIQQACGALAVSVYLGRGHNYILTSENLGGVYSYQMPAEKQFHQLDLVSRYGLSLYKSYRVAKFKVLV